MKLLLTLSGLILMSANVAHTQEKETEKTPIFKPSQVQLPDQTQKLQIKQKPKLVLKKDLVLEAAGTEFDKNVILLEDDGPSIDDKFEPDLSAGDIDNDVPQIREVFSLPAESVGETPQFDPMDRPEDINTKPAPLEGVDEAEIQLQDAKPPKTEPRPEPKSEMEKFIISDFFEGIPLIEAKEFAGNDDAYLREFLSDPEMVNHHPAALTILALSGTKEAEQTLVKYVVTGKGEIDSGAFAAKSDAVMALGYMANLTKGELGFGVLKQTFEKGGWKDLGVEWSFDFSKDPLAVEQSLYNMSLIGLALSGHDDARQMFDVAYEQAKSADGEWAVTTQDVEEYMKEYEKVRKMGLFEYNEAAVNPAKKQ